MVAGRHFGKISRIRGATKMQKKRRAKLQKTNSIAQIYFADNFRSSERPPIYKKRPPCPSDMVAGRHFGKFSRIRGATKMQKKRRAK